MGNRIAITGLGIVSALGMNVSENLDSLKKGISGISSLALLDSVYKNILPVGEIKKTDKQLADILQITYSEEYTRTALLAMIAAKEAWGVSGNNTDRSGIISATTVAGMRTSEQHYVDFLQHKDKSHFVETHDAGDSTEKVADYLGINDFVTTISTACSSSANSIMLGARLLKANKLDRVLVGGVDALSLFTINGFNTLMILDKEPCRSFDDDRAGLNLGEAAAFLQLVPEDKLRKTDHVYGYIAAYANANDAYHQTASSPEGVGATLAMQKAIDLAGIEKSEVDYINAHGTATHNNDLSEGLSIMKVFGDEIPAVSSTKPFTGHTLAAAGAVEAVFSVLSLQKGLIYPNLNFSNQMKELSFSPVVKLLQTNVKYVLSNSFGFGGNNSSIIYSGD